MTVVVGCACVRVESPKYKEVEQPAGLRIVEGLCDLQTMEVEKVCDD